VSAESPGVVAEHATERRIRAHDEDGPIREVGTGLAARVIGGGRGRELRREREGATLSEAALQLQLTPEHGGKLRRDGEPDARSAELARGGCVGLRERREDAILKVCVDPDPRVLDFETQDDVVTVPAHKRHADRHPTLVRELDRVVHQVHQQLPQAACVSHEPRWNISRFVVDQLEAFVRCTSCESLQTVGQALVQMKRCGPHGERPRLDLREVQDVDEDVEQRPRGVVHGLQEGALLGRQIAVEGQTRHADDAVHRSTDLVADVREEVALEARRGLGGLLGPNEKVVGLPLLGDVAPHDVGRPLLGHRHRGPTDQPLLSGRAPHHGLEAP
jgi:hypothetical protein